MFNLESLRKLPYKKALFFSASLIPIIAAIALMAPAQETLQLPREPIYPGQAPEEVSEAVFNARDMVIQRRYAEAEQLLWKFTRSHPDSPVGPTALMVVYQVRMLENEEFFLADEMRRVIELNRTALLKFRKVAPKNAWYYTLIGASLGIEGIYHLWRDDYVPAGLRGYAAIQDMQKALEADKSNWEARMGLGLYTYYRSVYALKVPFLPASVDRREEGIAEVKLAGEKRAYLDETARIALCRIYFDGHRYDESKRVADGLIEDYPSFLVSYLFAAKACFGAGKFAEAISYYKKAYQIDPSLTFAPYRLGVCFQNIGRKDIAAKWFKVAIESGKKKNGDKWGAEAYKQLRALASVKN